MIRGVELADVLARLPRDMPLCFDGRSLGVWVGVGRARDEDFGLVKTYIEVGEICPPEEDDDAEPVPHDPQPADAVSGSP